MTALSIAGIHYWRSHRESVAKAALCAEIEAERAARTWPAEPEPTNEERETADLYMRALEGLQLDAFYEGFSDAMDGIPWSAIPKPVATMLATNAGPLAIVDAAAARGSCRFSDASPLQGGRASDLHSLLLARGHAALARGDWVAAAEGVRRLVRVARDLDAAPRPRGVEMSWLSSEVHRRNAKKRAATLLALLATAPVLSPEAGPAMAAAASGDGWGTIEEYQRTIDLFEDQADAYALLLLGPDLEAYCDAQDAQMRELQRLLDSGPRKDRGVVEKFQDLIRGVRRPRAPVPTRDRIQIPTAAAAKLERNQWAPIIAAQRRRDMAALAPGGPLEGVGGKLGFLSPRWFRRTVVGEARVAVARAAAGIRAFQLAEGRPPRALEELVPAVLAEVPLDPFDGKPLLYEVEGEGWRVASRVWREAPKEGDDPEEFPSGEVRFPRPAK